MSGSLPRSPAGGVSEDTYVITRRSSRLCRSSKKKVPRESSSLWKQWDLSPSCEATDPKQSNSLWSSSSSKCVRSYSRKLSKKSSNDVFESLLAEKSSKSSWISSDEETHHEKGDPFSPDDGLLFASPMGDQKKQFNTPHSTTPTSTKSFPNHQQSNDSNDRQSIKQSMFCTPDTKKTIRLNKGLPSPPRCSPYCSPHCSPALKTSVLIHNSPRSNCSTPRSQFKRIKRTHPVVCMERLSDSLIEAYTTQSVDCHCSDLDEYNVLECDYCPTRVHAACHGISLEEYENIIEVGLLWKCSKCPKGESSESDDEEGGNTTHKDTTLKVSFPANQMVQVKGGKKWRRTMAAARASHGHVSPIVSKPPILEVQEEEKEEEEEEDSVFLSSPAFNSELDHAAMGLRELSLANDTEDDHSLTSFQEEVDESHNTCPLEDILYCCQQREILEFEDIYDGEVFEKSRKVGEGTFGEVYLLNGLDIDSEYPPVLKIIPVDGQIPVNEEPQTTLPEVLSEIHISLILSSLVEWGFTGCFVEINACHFVAGHYPPSLLQLWDNYHEEKESLNIRPDYLGSEQKYIAFEFSNGGKDLETSKLSDATQGLAIFNQVAHALAVAEDRLSFEHRDLHWGNILIQDSEEESIVFVLDDNSTYRVQTSGVKATIIDFSLSRLSIHELNVDIFKDLSVDETLFTAVGDYQFEIYRLMRNANQNNWGAFTPYTNVLWLHYLLDKLLSSVPYKQVKSRVHRGAMKTLRQLKKKMLDFISAKHYVLSHGTSSQTEDI